MIYLIEYKKMKISTIKKRQTHIKKELLRIKKVLIKLGAEKIILFGSLAQGRVGRTTDIDLLVVKKTNASFSKRLSEVYSNVVPKVAVDMLVYTPDELDSMSKWNIFIRKILKEGKVIYAA